MNTNLNIVTLEIAKKLKECGFYYSCDFYYTNDGQLVHDTEYRNWNDDPDKVSAPHAFIVPQWLRNEHQIDIFACRLTNITSPMLGYTYAIFHGDNVEPITSDNAQESYEAAIIKGIEYFCDNVNINKNTNVEG